MELDHLFIAVARGAPEAELLGEFGLEEGSGNRHRGQGTANRRFFFHNTMLELLWIECEEDARAAPADLLALAERCATPRRCASPFGVCLRPTANGPRPDFATRPYRPAYLPSGWSIEIADPAPVDEPLLFFIDFSSRPDRERREPLDHRAGLREITAVTLQGPSHASAGLRAVERAGLVSTATGAEHVLEIGFDGELRGRRRDFRPRLPLVFRW
ncbi:MAG: VOC family protein [Gammaproteobacteria bacterium]|nr:VOC family protein [Gammaproteobacteria bacterium]